MGSVVITQNRASLCLLQETVPAGNMSGRCWGRDLQHRELLTPHPALPGSFPAPPPFKLPVGACSNLGTWHGLDPVRNVGRVWAERRKGPVLTLGCKSESHHARLPSNAPWCKGSFPAQPQAGGGWAVPRQLLQQPRLPGTGHAAPLVLPNAKTPPPPRQQLVLGNSLLLHWLCCQDPWAAPPQLALALASTSTWTQAATQPLAPDTPWQHGSFPLARFNHEVATNALHRLGTPSPRLPDSKTPVGSPLEAVTFSPPPHTVPCWLQAVTGWHCAPAHATGPSTLRAQPRWPSWTPCGARAEALLPKAHPQWKRIDARESRGACTEATPSSPSPGSHCLAARLSFLTMVTFSLPW